MIRRGSEPGQCPAYSDPSGIGGYWLLTASGMPRRRERHGRAGEADADSVVGEMRLARWPGALRGRADVGPAGERARRVPPAPLDRAALAELLASLSDGPTSAVLGPVAIARRSRTLRLTGDAVRIGFSSTPMTGSRRRRRARLCATSKRQCHRLPRRPRLTWLSATALSTYWLSSLDSTVELQGSVQSGGSRVRATARSHGPAQRRWQRWDGATSSSKRSAPRGKGRRSGRRSAR